MKSDKDGSNAVVFAFFISGMRQSQMLCHHPKQEAEKETSNGYFWGAILFFNKPPHSFGFRFEFAIKKHVL